ncbi:carboxymuconolactone decarboxylase family protein [Rouxiella sp. Mn2063]|uniref:carboxymuconolactone decarboxylase family protein n=1 Tax=Rouxiella sp. Mn2063 TaxID=3395262 RepID=UPI003BE5C52C
MKRITPLDKMNNSQQAVFNKCPINVMRTMLVGDVDIASKYTEFGLGFGSIQIGNKLREAAIIRVAKLFNCEYELMHHIPNGIKSGLSEEDIKSILDGGVNNAEIKAMVDYIDEIVKDKVSCDTTFAKLRRFFSEGEVVELTLLIGHYIMTAVFILNCGVELDNAPIDKIYDN